MTVKCERGLVPFFHSFCDRYQRCSTSEFVNEGSQSSRNAITHNVESREELFTSEHFCWEQYCMLNTE